MSSIQELTDVDRLIHEPARLMIVSILSAVDQADFLYLLHETGLTRGNLSAHLSRLEEAGYIHIIKSFRGKVPQTLCNLTPKGQIAFQNYRKQLKSIVENI
jgi:DNA-binding transcriptional ArsR family regulator